MDPTLSEIRIFAGNFAPLSWMFCQGQLMSIAENTALFSLLGTTYGGDGQVTFALPDFRGRRAVGTGQGPGLSLYDLGEVSGTESRSLLASNMPSHTHALTDTFTVTAIMRCLNDVGDQLSPGGNYFALPENATTTIYSPSHDGNLANVRATVNTSTFIIGPTGGSQPFSIMEPYLALNFIIAVEGIYPSRN